MGSRYGGYGGDYRSPPPPPPPPGSHAGGDYRPPPPPGSHAGSDYRSPPPPASHAGGGGGGGGGRWDAERFARESRAPPVMERERFEERDRYYNDRYAERGPERSRPPVDERIVFEERERFAPPRRPERLYYEEEEFDFRRAPPAGAIVPYARREEPPPRPGLLRRQSSLDFYDRKPARRFDQLDPDYRIPVRIPPRRPTPPRYEPPRYAERDFEDIRIAEPDDYGHEEFRNYREREWSTSRRRHRSRSSSSSGTEKGEPVEIEKPFPRKGKTRMPKRLVHTRAIIELGYPYEEEGEVIVIQKALGKENIDEVVNLSKTYKVEEEKSTTYVFEREKVKSPKPETVVEEKITHMSLSDAPRSVREWDTLKVKERSRSPSPAATHRSHKTHLSSHHGSHHSSRHRSHSHVTRSRRSSSPSVVEEIIEKREIREISPSHTHHSRRRSSPREVIERREIVEDIGESNSIHAGPLALVVPERRHKTDSQIKEEIRALERERRMLRTERVERVRPVEREVIIERESPEVIEVKKDRKAPDPRIIRAMMATLT